MEVDNMTRIYVCRQRSNAIDIIYAIKTTEYGRKRIAED